MLDEYFAYFGLTVGVLIIIGVGLVVFLLVAILLEMRTKTLFPERNAKSEDDDLFSFVDDSDEEDS